MAGLKLGVFGGTFDPPHHGHLILAEEACFQLQLDRLLWVLTPDPPHKQGREITPLPFRLEMLAAAIQDHPGFELSRVDIDRPAPHYAVGTLQWLRQAYPQVEWTYLMGGDSLHDLPDWYHPQEFVAQVDAIGVVRRPFDRLDLEALEAHLPGVSAKIKMVKAPLIQIASSDIRQRVRAGRPFRYFLPAPVYRVIQEYNLYRGEPEM